MRARLKVAIRTLLSKDDKTRVERFEGTADGASRRDSAYSSSNRRRAGIAHGGYHPVLPGRQQCRIAKARGNLLPHRLQIGCSQMARFALVACDLDYLLAEVFSTQKSNEFARRIFQSIGHVFSVFDGSFV